VDIKIENLKYDDLEQYKALIDNCFGGSQDIEIYRNSYKLDRNYEIIVAKLDGKIIGSITMQKIDLFTFSFQPVIELFNISVNSDYREHKVGSIMMDYVKKYAKEHGYKQIILTCLDDQPVIHKFYEKVGFTKANSRKYSMPV